MTKPHPSVAVAVPVTFVVVGVPHSTVRFAGPVILGGVVSRIVMVWSALERLPQASVAVQVLEMTLVAAQELLTESL